MKRVTPCWCLCVVVCGVCCSFSSIIDRKGMESSKGFKDDSSSDGADGKKAENKEGIW